MERIQVSEGATIQTLKRQITDSLEVPLEDITLSTDKDLVRTSWSSLIVCLLL